MKKKLLLFLLLILSGFQVKAQCWQSAAAGNEYTVALGTDGILWAWGSNAQGQLGDGTFTNSNIAKKIGTANDWKTVDAGQAFTVAIKKDSTLWVWGDNFYGQLCDGTTTDSTVPIQIGTAKDWKTISTGSAHGIALKTNGTLWAWGQNNKGQLGDGTTINRNILTQIGTDTDWESIETGYSCTFAIKKDGTLWAWGQNTNGQLGDNTTIDSHIPKRIGTASDWKTISTGYHHTAAIKTDGTLWAWGESAYGNLGNGTSTDQYVPTKTGTANDWKTVSVGGDYTVAIKTDGSLWTWGYNLYGQLGNGANANVFVPIKIGSENNWQTIATGAFHTVALNTANAIWIWGRNSENQLGGGLTTDKNIPTLVNCPGTLSMTADLTQISCPDAADGSVSITSVSGGTAPYTYVWSNGKTTATISGLTAGNYTCTVKDAASLYIIRSFSITQPTPISFTATITNACNNNNGSISIIASGGVPSYQYAISPAFIYQNSNVFDGLSAGNYTINIKDNKGCTLTNTLVITTANTIPPIANAQTFSNGATVANLQATGLDIKWFNTLTEGNALGLSTLLQTGKYYASQTINGCESPRTAIDVTITTISDNGKIPTNGLLAYYPFNSNANDASGNEFHGIATDVTSISDRGLNTNKAYSFNGKTSNIEADVKNYPLKGGSRTIAGWFKASSPINSKESDFCIVSYGNVSDPDYWFKISLSSKGYLDLQFDSKTFTSQENYFTNQWTFFTMVFNDDTNTFSLYINNVMKLNGSADLYTNGYGNLFRIGKNKSNNYFEGLIDDIGIWDRVLTTQEISNLYNSTTAVLPLIATISANTQTGACGEEIVLNCKTSIGGANTYLWSRDGVVIPQATSATYIAALSGNYTVEVSAVNSGTTTSNILALTINYTNPPVAVAQTFNNGAIVANLQAAGVNIKWYTSAVGGNPLPVSMLLQTGQYFASQTKNECESKTRAAVNVTVTGPILYTTISDANFEQKLIDLGIDTDGLNGKISTANILNVTHLDLSNSNISNLTGIEKFTALTYLNCNYNKLTTIDVTNNKQLFRLSLHDNKLTSLDVSANLDLYNLTFSLNQISTIDLSKNKNLHHLAADRNLLTSIDFTGNPEILELSCGNNNLTELNVSNLKNLALLSCGFINITKLDLSANIKLDALYCYNTPLTTLDLSHNVMLETLSATANQFTSLDLSHNPLLNLIFLELNPLTSLNVKNGNNKNFVLPSETGKKASGQFTSFLKINGLNCIKVDDAAFSNANWSKIKETNTTYSETCTLGLEESVFDKVVVYPNPAKGEVHINNIALEKVTVYNTIGQLVKTIKLNSGTTNNTIHLSDLPRGVYFVYLINEDAASAKKIILE